MAKKKKVLITIIAIIILAAISMFILFFVMSKNVKEYEQSDFQGIDINEIEDGVYEGSEDGGMVTAEVEVLVENHEITNVEIIQHRYGKGKKAEAITGDIVKNNSIEVDGVSGATLSSNVIKKAVWNALSEK